MIRTLHRLLAGVLFLCCALAAGAQTTSVTAIDPSINVTPAGDSPTAKDVSPPFVNGIVGGGSVELGQNVLLIVSVNVPSNGIVAFNYQWRKNGSDLAGATGSSYALGAVSAADSGTYSVVVSNDAGSSVGSTDVTVKPLAAPVITTQPRATVAQVGQAVTFSFVATGSFPRTYQWRKDGNDLTGATNATLTLPAITIADSGVYTVAIANSQGSVTSSAASLTVNAATPPVLASGSPPDGNPLQGVQASLFVSINSGSSPFTYQWFKNGAALPSATSSQLTFNPVTLTDSGKYYVVVTNPAGSATSREATLTVAPATPVTIAANPQSQSIIIGQSVNFNVSSNGSSPVTYQWLKNGAPISGATSSNYFINAVAASDAASYAVVVTNILGSVTSSAATLTVTPAVAPTITTAPTGQTVPYFGTINLNVQASGSSPFTFQWKKDGVPVGGSGSSNFFLSSATPANSGVYTVTVTNAGGSVTSTGATVTVTAAVAPTITQQPVALQAGQGLAASFSVNVNTIGAGSVTFQWLKNGFPISGANSTNYFINSAQPADAADYTLTVTGPGGSVTSAAAHLTVLPPVPPSVQGWSVGSPNYVTLGSSATLGGFINPTGTPPFAYQWAKDGVPIPGATNSNLSFSSVTANDLGTYTLTISNDAGLITSPGWRLRLSGNATFGSPVTTPWLDVGRVGDIVYFLATVPARIERYDLAGERWLPTTLLSDTLVPTAFVPAAEGVYIAYGRTLARRALDLTGEQVIANASANVPQMFVYGNFLYYSISTSSSSVFGSQNYNTLSRATLQAGPAASIGYFGGYRQVAIAASIGKGFGSTTTVSPGDIETFTLAADGTVSGNIDSPYHGTMPVGSRPFVLPGDQFVADDAGTVYRTADLTYAGSFGEALTDLTFLADGTPVVLRGAVLTTARTDNFTETARTRLAQPALRVFTRGTGVFAFSAGTGTTPFTAVKVTTANFAPATSPTIPVPASGRFSVDDAFIGEDGIVQVFSRTLQAFLRWNPATRAYLPSVPLRMTPSVVFHQAGNRRALVLYPDGVITAVPLGAGAVVEQPLANLGHYVRAMVDLGDAFTVNYSDAQDSGDGRMILGASGGPKFINTSLYEGTGLAWLPATRRLYTVPAFSGALGYEVITSANTLSSATNDRKTAAGPATTPIRFNADGTLLATMNGSVFNADLAQVGTLANNITDAAWLTAGLYTVRSFNGATQVQRWARTTYLQTGTLSLDGTPVRILPISDQQFVVVTSVLGYLSLNLVNADLSVSLPTNAGSYSGVYVGTLGPGGTAGDFALYVRSDRTGVLLVNATNPRASLLATAVTLNADGTFVVNARDLATSANRAINGSIAADGSVTGAIGSLNLTFAGAKSSGANGAAGFYQAAAVNGGSGSAYAIIGADGRGVVVAQNTATTEGGAGTLDVTGKITVSTATGAKLTAALDPTGALTAVADKGSLAATTFSGLRDGIAHTDRLANISTRGRAGSGGDMMTAGFVISGSAPRQVLIRAIGPALSGFGFTSFLTKPHLALFHGGTQLAASDSWGLSARATDIATMANQVGAFPLTTGSADAALLATLDPGDYTAQVTSNDTTAGTALVEVYDAGSGAGSTVPHLIDIATLGRVTANDQLVAGIVITGNVPKRVLVRAVGPTLATIGVGGTLADPVLNIYSGQTVICTNDDWGNGSTASTASEVAVAATGAGAFPLTIGGKDAAILLTLQPGNYTAIISGKSGATGVALVEVYEVNN